MELAAIEAHLLKGTAELGPGIGAGCLAALLLFGGRSRTASILRRAVRPHKDWNPHAIAEAGQSWVEGIRNCAPHLQDQNPCYICKARQQKPLGNHCGQKMSRINSKDWR